VFWQRRHFEFTFLEENHTQKVILKRRYAEVNEKLVDKRNTYFAEQTMKKKIKNRST
jgi:hypothetical protein